MKRIVATALSCLALASMVLVLAGCSSSSNYEPQSKDPVVSAPVIGEEGVLRVGVDTTSAPLASESDGKIVGLDVDIAAALADSLGLKLSIVDVGSDPATALQEGTVDIVLGIDNSMISDAKFWVSESYLPTGVVLFSANPEAGVPTAGTDVKITAQSNSKSSWAVGNEFGEDAVINTDNLKECFENLSSGTAQYVAADAVIGSYAAHAVGVDASIVALMQQPAGYCIGVAQENLELQTAITSALTEISSNGIIGVIEQKWLGAVLDLSSIPLAVTVDKKDDKKDEEQTDEADTASANEDSTKTDVAE